MEIIRILDYETSKRIFKTGLIHWTPYIYVDGELKEKVPGIDYFGQEVIPAQYVVLNRNG